MEKKIWSKPEMHEFAFAANEYVAACGDENKKYLFTCNAGGGESGYVWRENNGNDELQSGINRKNNPTDGYGKDDYLGGYHACGTTHEASTTDDFYNGYYLPYDKWNDGRFDPLNVLKVIIWRGSKNDNIHCTTDLDIKNWTTAKS